MSEKLRLTQVFDFYLTHVIREAREASEALKGSFLIEKKFRGRYIRTHILFVCYTDELNVEDEIETWFKIYKWIEEEKEKLLQRYKVENDVVIVLYPRFISFKEYYSIPRANRTHLDKKKIVWHRELNSII